MMATRGAFATAALRATLFLGILSDSALWAVDCSVANPSFTISPGSLFTVSTVGFSSAEMSTAFNYWSSACPEYGVEFPEFQLGGSGGIPILVIKNVGRSSATGGGCGRFRPDLVNGHLEGGTIDVWTQQSDGTSCEPLTDVIAHELGHALGLDDVTASACFGHIMGVRVLSTRTVSADDCAMADDMWNTSSESSPPPDPYCDAYCWTSCTNNVCPCCAPDTGCPILIDLENDGIHLTGLNDPVWFDIDADGRLDLMSWTDRGEGLLALDRNGNGRIDDGRELFGDATRLADGSRALNGYLALAELDSWLLGGNSDGKIDAADGAFANLKLWTDRNHDGVSQEEELAQLSDTHVVGISLDYKRSNRTDRYGNEFRFRSRAWKQLRPNVQRPLLTWDVYFLVAR